MYLHDVSSMCAIVVWIIRMIIGLNHRQPTFADILFDIQRCEDIETSEHFHPQIEERSLFGDFFKLENIKFPT